MPRLVPSNQKRAHAAGTGTLDAGDANPAGRLLDELAWWHDNGQLRYKTDEDARRRQAHRDREIRPIEVDPN